jgi:hypothetical protein
MIKKLLNIYDEDLYLSIQVHAKTNRSDANAFINKAMEEKAQRDGVKMISVGAAEKIVRETKAEDISFDEIAEVDFEEPVEDDKTF